MDYVEWIKSHSVAILSVAIAVLITIIVFLTVFVTASPYVAIKHSVGPASTLTLDASKRSIISIGDFACAEPSPDAMATIATELAASVSGYSETASDPNDQNSGADAALDLLTNSTIQDLFSRTQGIQAIRDGMYRLCEARMNDGITKDFYEEQMIDLLVTLNFIVPLELCIKGSLELHPMTDISSKQLTPLEKVELKTRFMKECTAFASEFGRMIAANASERINARRSANFQYSIEQLRLRSFLEQAQQQEATGAAAQGNQVSNPSSN